MTSQAEMFSAIKSLELLFSYSLRPCASELEVSLVALSDSSEIPAANYMSFLLKVVNRNHSCVLRGLRIIQYSW